MNLRRGLLRAWVLFSLVWIVTVGTVLTLNWAKDPRWNRQYDKSPTATEISDCSAKFPGPWCTASFVLSEPVRQSEKWLSWTLIVFGIPIALLALGRAAIWVVSGFKSN
jgi:hypothetical protein